MSKAEWHYTAPFQEKARVSAKDVVGGILSEKGANSFQSTTPGDREEGHFGFWANYLEGKNITMGDVVALSHLFHTAFHERALPITGLRCVFDATKDGNAMVVPHFYERLFLSVLEQRHILPEQIAETMLVARTKLYTLLNRIEVDTVPGDEPAKGIVSVNLIFQPRAPIEKDQLDFETTMRRIVSENFTKAGLVLSPESFSSEWLKRE